MTTKDQRCPKCGYKLIFVTLPNSEPGSLYATTGYHCLHCESDLIKKAEKEK